jgi:heptosyltransferase-2
MDLSNAKKILIIRFSSLGDILLTTPLIRSFKKQYKQLKIDFVVKEQFQDVVLNNPYLNKIYSLQNFEELKKIKNELLKNNYDVVVDLQNNFRSKKLVSGLSKNIFRFKKPNINKFLLVKFKINFLKEMIPIPIRYANSIPNFQLDNKSLELFLPKDVNPAITKNADIIGLCPGSVHKTKMWPEEYFFELGNIFVNKGYKVVLFGGKSDKQICKKIANQIPGSVDLSNDNKLYETSANMKICKTVICNDSGLMHTAVASNIPVVAIFGSTVKEFGFAPYKSKSLVIENNSLSCRPCSHIGLAKCPKKHFNCMQTLTPKLVFEKTLNFIKTI